MQTGQTSDRDHKMILLDPTLLAELHRAGWRGAVSRNAAALGVADPVRLERYTPRTRAALASALEIPTLEHLPLPDVTAVQELRSLQKYLSYEERLLLALARGAGYQVAVDKPILSHAEKFLGKGRVLSRDSLVTLTGLQFESAATPDASEMAALWKLWGDVGQTATERVRAEMHAQGIGVVYKRDGLVVEALPDGTIRPLSESN